MCHCHESEAETHLQIEVGLGALLLEMDEACEVRARTSSSKWFDIIVLGNGQDDGVVRQVTFTNSTLDDEIVIELQVRALAAQQNDRCILASLEVRGTPMPLTQAPSG